jgi:hypothetical protein
MNYKVHRLEVDKSNLQEKLEKFLNSLHGEVISVFPHIRPSFQFMGATAKIDYLLIIENLDAQLH